MDIIGQLHAPVAITPEKEAPVLIRLECERFPKLTPSFFSNLLFFLEEIKQMLEIISFGVMSECFSSSF
jgi:hypothetical protein